MGGARHSRHTQNPAPTGERIMLSTQLMNKEQQEDSNKLFLSISLIVGQFYRLKRVTRECCFLFIPIYDVRYSVNEKSKDVRA